MEIIDAGPFIVNGENITAVGLQKLSWKEVMDPCRPESGPLLRRYYLSRTGPSHVYLHHLMRSDNARHFHDHPWAFTTVLLTGDYLEHTPDGVFRRKCGEVLYRPATWLHWLELERPVWTLVVTGLLERRWGFLTEDGWIDHRNYGPAFCD